MYFLRKQTASASPRLPVNASHEVHVLDKTDEVDIGAADDRLPTTTQATDAVSSLHADTAYQNLAPTEYRHNADVQTDIDEQEEVGDAQVPTLTDSLDLEAHPPTSPSTTPSRGLSPTGAAINPEKNTAQMDNESSDKHQAEDSREAFLRRSGGNRSSAPPETSRSLRDQEAARYIKHPDPSIAHILPPPTAPLYLQILTYIQRWGIWSTMVKDNDLRERLLTKMAEKMETVWLEGMKQGLIPETIVGLIPFQGDPKMQSGQELAASIIQSSSPGRQITHQKRPRRAVSPSREVVLKSNRTEGAKYAITAGELRESRVTPEMIENRVASHDLDEGDDLMQQILEQLDRDTLEGSDWYGIYDRTSHNYMGRDLMTYCLWEVQMSRLELQKYNDLMERFKTAQQKRNTQARLDAERWSHDRHLALALILHKKEDEDELHNRSKATHRHDKDGNRMASTLSEDVSEDPSALTYLGTRPMQASNQKVFGEVDEVLAAVKHQSEESVQDGEAIGVSSIDPDQGNRNDINAGKSSTAHDLNIGLEAQQDDPDLEAATDLATMPAAIDTFLHNEADAREEASQVQEYIDGIILPEINGILRSAGQAELAPGTKLRHAKFALRSVGIPKEWRDQFAQKLRDFKQQFQAGVGVVNENPDAEVMDFDDLPTQQEIIDSIPADGISPEDFGDIFSEQVDPNDGRWYKLLSHVAYLDKAKKLWFVKQWPNDVKIANDHFDAFEDSILTPHTAATMPDPSRASTITNKTIPKITLKVPSLKLVLRLSPQRRFDPADYSIHTVNNTKGFRWRYIPGTTVSERDAMDSHVADYVKNRINQDRIKKQSEDASLRMTSDRFGNYEQLSNPNQGRGKSIVHGVWDLRSRKPLDVESVKWFFEGKDGEWPTPKLEFNAFGERSLTNEVELREIEDAIARGNVAGRAKAASDPSNGKIDGRARNVVSRRDGGTGGVKREKGACKGKEKGEAKKNTARLPPPLPEGLPSSSMGARKRKGAEMWEVVEGRRPKRRAAREGVRYEDDGTDVEEDRVGNEEWTPS